MFKNIIINKNRKKIQPRVVLTTSLKVFVSAVIFTANQQNSIGKPTVNTKPTLNGTF